MDDYEDLMMRARGRYAPDMVKLADWLIRNDPFAGIPDPAAYVAAMGALATATQRLTGLLSDVSLVGGVSDETAIEIDEATEGALTALQAARATMGERNE